MPFARFIGRSSRELGRPFLEPFSKLATTEDTEGTEEQS